MTAKPMTNKSPIFQKHKITLRQRSATPPKEVKFRSVATAPTDYNRPVIANYSQAVSFSDYIRAVQQQQHTR